MPRDILGEYGSDIPHPQAPTAGHDTQAPCKELPYSPPQGPIGISNPSHGSLGGTNHGPCGTQHEG